jgi:hypothetical protein
MNGRQLINILSLDRYTAQTFRGLAMRDSDRLPHANVLLPSLYIVNSDKEEGKGEHWCAAFYYADTREFFDPFGNPPAFYGFEKLLGSRKTLYSISNSVCIQNVLSSCCGAHCLFYALHRCRGMVLHDIIELYDESDMQKNDKMVTQFVAQFGSEYTL